MCLRTCEARVRAHTCTRVQARRRVCVRGQPTRARVHACLYVRARLRHVLCMRILARMRARACVACACTDKCMYNMHEHITAVRVVS